MAAALTAISSESQRVRIKLSSLVVCAFADSSGGRVGGGRKPSQRSRSAIVVVGQNEVEQYFIFKAWARHCTTDELINEIFATDDQWKPKVFALDATGTQTLFIDALHRECREKNRRDHFQDHVFEGDKDWRIETTLQPLQSAGKLFVLTEGMDDLKGEYESFPGSNFKDTLDALVGCILQFPRRHKPEEAREEMRQYRSYLREQRVDPQEALRRAAAAFEEARDRSAWNRRTAMGRMIGPDGFPVGPWRGRR
jgi:hypothetical protein